MKNMLFPIVIVALTAQAPAPSPAPSSAPLLTIDYAFKVTPSGYSNPISNGESGVAGYATYGTPQSGGGGLQGTSGTLRVAILGHAKDGGTLVRMTDLFAGNPQENSVPFSIDCELYQGGNASCTQPPYGVSYDERVLLPYLAPSFYATDAKMPLKVMFLEQEPAGRYMTQHLVTLTPAPGADSNRTDFTLSADTRRKGATLTDTEGHETGKIVYDHSLGLPVSIDYDWQNTRPGNDAAAGEYRVQLTLSKVS